MKKENYINQGLQHFVPDEMRDLYFKFEADFVEDNVRCIPMVVRFKMDAAGIKLKLAEWSKFSVDERKELAIRDCSHEEEIKRYRDLLVSLVEKYTGNAATEMEIEQSPSWADAFVIPTPLQARAREINSVISIKQWTGLSHLQRFALLKLCRPGHESKNFEKAMKEFKIIE